MREKKRSFPLLIYFAYIALLFFSISFSTAKVMDAMNRGTVRISDEWTYQALRSGQEIPISEFVEKYSFEPGKEYTIRGKLPKDLKGSEALYFYSRNLELTVLVDGKPIYSVVSANGQDISGSIENVVSLPTDAEGKEVVITYHSDGFYRYKPIEEVYLGKESGFVSRILMLQLSPLILALVCFSIGIFQLVFSMAMHGDAARQMLYLGGISILYSLWVFGASGLLDFLSKYQYNGQAIRHLALSLLSYPILKYFYLRFKIRQTFLDKALKILAFCNFLIVFLLHIFVKLPLEEGALITFLILLITFGRMSFDIIRNFLKHVYKSIWDNGALSSLGILLMTIGSGVDVFRYCFIIGKRGMLFSPLCFLIMMGILSFRSLQAALEMIQLGKRSETVKQLAYFDILTNVYNRTALNEDMEKLEQSKNEKKSIGIVQFDVNNLKWVNDTLGHLAGDQLLKAAAHTIKEGFEGLGKAYRFGGDEFVVIIEENAKERYALGIQQMEGFIAKHNKNCPKEEHISIAYGVAYYDPSKEQTLWQIQELADEQMYIRKRRMKAGMGEKNVRK